MIVTSLITANRTKAKYLLLFFNLNKKLLFQIKSASYLTSCFPNRRQQFEPFSSRIKQLLSSSLSSNSKQTNQFVNNNLKYISSSSSLFLSIKSTNFSSIDDKSKSNSSSISNNLSLDKENYLFTIPNCLTISRILLTPFINYCVLINQHEIACGLFFLAGLTDFLDGYIARNYPNQKSYLGSILDPLADKLLIGSLTVTLTLNKMIPFELAFLILARDISLIVASLIVRYKMLDKPRTFEKYINVRKYSKVQIEADFISKFNTVLQLALITLTLPSNLFDYNKSYFLIFLQFLTGTTTILSSISYLAKRGSYKLVNQNKQQQQTTNSTNDNNNNNKLNENNKRSIK